MSAKKGRALLLRIEDGKGSFVTIAGLRAGLLTLENGAIDITDPTTRSELLPGQSVGHVSLSGAGIFKDAASAELLLAAYFSEPTPTLQLVVANVGALTGFFDVSALDFTGERDGETTFTVRLNSAADVAVTQGGAE